jgi:hypothetical protein
MKFINTDGMAFIGPGSEWFWTAVSGLILVVTFLAIYRQLRLARSAGAYEQLAAFERELDSERMVRVELELLVSLRDGVDPAHVPPGAAYVIGGFWQRTGALVRSGHLDPKLLRRGSLGAVGFWWPAMAPYARKARAERPQPSFLVDFEWLAGIMAELDRPAGPSTPGRDEAHLPVSPREAIAIFEDRLRVEETLRTVIVASPDRALAGQHRHRGSTLRAGDTASDIRERCATKGPHTEAHRRSSAP